MKRLFLVVFFILYLSSSAFSAVELDADFNGAVDADKGGTNVQSYAALKAALSIDEVDNTSDANKPISTLTQTELDSKEDDLGNPPVNGYVLSSTIAGFRAWIDVSGGTAIWGSILGTLADQTDLQNEFDLKQNLLTFGISDGNSILIDSASVGSGEYAIFTPLGLQSFSIAQVKSNLSLEQLDNTSDLDKPVSTDQQTALDLKEDSLPAVSEDVSFLTSLITGVRSFLTISETKTALSIENVDNTADIDKAISTLQQNALDLKLDISSAFDPDSPGELGATTPAKGNFTEIEIPFVDEEAGIFWDEANTVAPVSVYGIYPYNGNMYKIENSVHSLMNAGGGGTAIVEVADTPEGWEMIPGTLYIAQDDGELSFLLADSSEVFRYAATSSTALHNIFLTVAETDGSTVDINGTSYSNGGPYTISALTGSIPMDISYVTADQTVWTGADSGDVTGTTPNFFINTTAADKTLIATISSTTSYASILFNAQFENTGTSNKPIGLTADTTTLVFVTTPAGSILTGTYAASYAAGTNDRISWTNTADAIFNRVDGAGFMRITPGPAFADDANYFESYYDVDNFIRIRDRLTAGVLEIFWTGAGVEYFAYTTSPILTASTASDITFSWGANATDFVIYVNGVAQAMTRTGTLTAMAASPANGTVRVGGNSQFGSSAIDAIYDQLIISNDSTEDLNAIKNITDFN